MNRYLASIVIGLLLLITGEHLLYAQPITQIVRLGDGTNLSVLTATGAIKTDGTATTQPVSAVGTFTVTGIGTPGTPAAGVVTTQGNGADPCQSSGVAKSSVAFNATATMQLVAAVVAQTVYVCHFSASIVGTSPSMSLEYGTGVTCGTGTIGLTGTMSPTAGSIILMGYGGTVVKTASANALCIAISGTTPNVQGVLVYVQQ